MGVLGRLEFGESTPARGWCPKKGGCTTEWVEALAVEGEGLGRSRGGLTSKIHLAVDGRGLPMSILVTPGQAGDNPELLALLVSVMRSGLEKQSSDSESSQAPGSGVAVAKPTWVMKLIATQPVTSANSISAQV